MLGTASKAALCALCVLAAVGAAAERIPEFDGVARLFNVDRATIVYPAGPGEDVPINRASAILRASFLEERYGVITSVAADTEITDEQRRGHLLVLGWGNRLLGTDEAPFPVERTDSGRRYMGSELEPDDDLVLIHRSPYNEQKYLAFWSRIDPELDRFEVFPFIGSDWAVYRDYFVIEQGMYVLDRPWPPRHQEHANTRHRLVMDPVRSRSEHYTLHAASGLDEASVRAILEARETSLQQAIEWLGDPGDDFRIELHVYDTREAKKIRTGVGNEAHAIPSRGELYMTQRQARSLDPHEEIHLVAAQLLGDCSLTALFEGLAMSLESDELDVFAAALAENDSAPSFEVLFNDERLRNIPNPGLAFPVSALLVSWLRDAGDDKLERVYSATMLTAADEIAAVMDMNVKQSEAAFRKWLVERGRSAGRELAVRKALAEAQALQARGDAAGRVAALVRAVELMPDKASIRYSLALAQVDALDYKGAEKNLKRLTRGSSPEASSHAIFGHYQLGRLYELQGQRDKALVEYRRVLELPDRRGAHEKAREAMAAAGAGNGQG